MGFIFRKCARQRAVPIIKATGKKAAALKRLRAFLDAEEPQTVEFLVSLWDEQQSAITYKDLREAVLLGGMSEKQLAQWKIDYSKFVTEKLAPQWEKAILEAAEELKQQYPYFLYNPQSELAQEFIRQRGAFFVKNIIHEQEKALQAATLHALNLNNAMTADDLSRLLRPMIGLTRPQAIANTNHYNAVYLSGLKAGAGEKAATKKARESTVRYAHRQERYRAITIARTELATAYNQGGYGATLDAQAQGYIGYCAKIWLTADDERVCPECGGLDGKSVNIDEKFSNGVDLPPAHPNCRCGVIFEEISPPLLTNSADSSIMGSGGAEQIEVETGMGAETLDREQKIKDGEQGISKNSYETAIVYDTDGNELFRQDGGEGSVSLTPEQIEQLKGNIITHNHPSAIKDGSSGVSVMSSSDIRVDGNALPFEGRMVTGKGQLDIITYTKKFNRDNARLLANKMEQIEKYYKKTANTNAIINDIKSGDIRRNSTVEGASDITVRVWNTLSVQQRTDFIRSVQNERHINYVISVQSILESNASRYGYVYQSNINEIAR